MRALLLGRVWPAFRNSRNHDHHRRDGKICRSKEAGSKPGSATATGSRSCVRPHRSDIPFDTGSCNNNPVWTSADIEIVLDDELTDDAIATVRIVTPLGELLVMAEAEQNERELVLHRLHIQGDTLGPNDLGPAHLRQLARAVMERMDFDAIIIEGATRTSGTRRGRVPRTLRFTRRIPAASGTDLC